MCLQASFASKAKKEGFEQIAALFLKTADNKKEHAKMWFKELEGIGSGMEPPPHCPPCLSSRRIT